jgi:hypothetical protein
VRNFGNLLIGVLLSVFVASIASGLIHFAVNLKQIVEVNVARQGSELAFLDPQLDCAPAFAHNLSCFCDGQNFLGHF